MAIIFAMDAIAVLHAYVEALQRSDFSAVKALCAPGATLVSPMLGELPADAFYDGMAEATKSIDVRPIKFFTGAQGWHGAALHLHFAWTTKDGRSMAFDAVDLFTLDAETGKVTRIEVLYDTHPLRVQAAPAPKELTP